MGINVLCKYTCFFQEPWFTYLHNMPSYENANIFGAYWLITVWNPSTKDVCMQGDSILTSFLVHVLSKMDSIFLAGLEPESNQRYTCTT